MYFNPFKLVRASFVEFFGSFWGLMGRLGQVPFITVNVVFFVVALNVPPFLGMVGVSDGVILSVLNVFVVGVLGVNFFAAVRRAHDVGFSAAVLFVGFVPWVGWLLLVVFLFWKGEGRVNVWGPVPSDAGLDGMVRGSDGF
jgi:uncharacterized membrane protein YhaH (DUF805 family)